MQVDHKQNLKKNIEDKGDKTTNDNRKGIYEKPVLPFISHSI